MLIGSVLHRQDFKDGSFVNGCSIGILMILVMLALLYAWMELGAPRRYSVASPTGTSS